MASSAPSKQATATEARLRGDILESVLSGRERVESAREELRKQGRHLRKSLESAKGLSRQSGATGEQVNRLVDETRTGCVRRLLCCCRSCLCRSEGVLGEGSPRRPSGSLIGSAETSQEDERVELSETLARLRRLVQVEKRAESSWRRPLVPLGKGAPVGLDIWHRQLESSLGQLQQVAEEMGQALEEQTRLAQMLTVYLNEGVNQVLGASKRLERVVR